MPGRPNIVVIMTDQQRADLCAREGYPLDTTPFLDSLADSGADFRKAYTSTPVCAPARVSLFTGRYPSATRVRVNFNTSDATYEADLLHVLKHLGYKTALCGKNHSHIAVERFDFCERFSHGGGSSPDRTDEEKAFDDFLSGLNHHTCLEPTPFPIERQGPHRMVSKAQHWIEGLDGKPFFLWMSFPEPHNPFQVPEPYFSMFAPERLPRPQTGRADLDRKGFRWKWLRETWSRSLPDYEKQLDRARANYHGMLRLIDDQIRRFVEFLEDKNLRDNTVIVFLTDHGDFVGEYDLIRKGPDLPEVLVRMPLLISGPRINSGNRVTEAGRAHSGRCPGQKPVACSFRRRLSCRRIPQRLRGTGLRRTALQWNGKPDPGRGRRPDFPGSNGLSQFLDPERHNENGPERRLETCIQRFG
jgi:arylsulfatase A-like enzyme